MTPFSLFILLYDDVLFVLPILHSFGIARLVRIDQLELIDITSFHPTNHLTPSIVYIPFHLFSLGTIYSIYANQQFYCILSTVYNNSI
jgi:hypothetical protein